MNTNNKDSVEKLEETWGLHWSELKKNIITRSQSLKGRETNSVLDYFFASNQIKYFHRIEQREGSDHFPIEILFEISDNPKINKNYKITKPNRNPNKQQILELLNSDWPLKIPNLKWLSKSNILRPKVYISSEKAKIFNCVEWSKIQKVYNDQSTKEYSTLINDINNLKKTDIIKFYKIINNILKYKERGKIVKNIRIGGMIKERKESIRLWTDYYKTLLNNDEKFTQQRFNSQIEHTINVEEGLERVAKRKAVGVDGVSGEWIILNKDEDDDLKSIKIEKLRTVFKEVIQTSSIPDFWMKSKIVLISKENNNTPEIMNTRPIAILPVITKAFELSILRNLEKIAYKQSYISHNQRGFTSKKSTIENIDDLFDFWMKAKERRKETRSSSALIFIDLKRAYDCVNRNKLLNLLDEARIPGDIIEIIKEMFNKSQIIIDGISTFKTTKGLLQGSCLSPILFNFYINPMLRNLEKLNAWCRAYADDIVIAVDNLQDINMYLKVVLEWYIVYEIELNPIKSGILRVLNKAGKIKGIKNIAKIPEVTE